VYVAPRAGIAGRRPKDHGAKGGSTIQPDRQLTISGDLSAGDLAQVRAAVTEFVLTHGLTADSATMFVMAVNEAVANVIQHANGHGDVVVFCDGMRCVAEITDTGAGFVDDASEDPVPPEQLGGRGIWLMRRCVDEVAIASVPQGTVVRLATSVLARRSASP
jgi:anti-sigma regulatory factor (Ser/Thr protein kinase)